MPTNAVRRQTAPACGRLVVLEARGNKPIADANAENYASNLIINFPSMPDVIDLTRRADYIVTTNPAFPDGIHTYMGTSVLEIPISFKLHAMDKEYCPKGVLTLLQVAAELESLILPIGDDRAVIEVGPTLAPEATHSGTLYNAQNARILGGNVATNTLYPPATCYLELILTERTGPGVACVGYIKEVSIKLGGPYLKGPGARTSGNERSVRGEGRSQLLPTTGEFSFTFVHHPGHTNGFFIDSAEIRSERQAYALTVRNQFYNTQHLLTNVSFQGVDNPALALPPASAPNTQPIRTP
jgi:hypothetical protein